MLTLGSPASVVAAIREDADAEVARIREEAASAIAAIRAEAAVADVKVPDREARLAAARRESEELVARQEWAGRRAAIEQREMWIQRVVTTAQHAWRTVPLEALIEEARARLPEGPYEVEESPRGGCVVKVGAVAFDNTFDARSQRLEAQWRNALSAMVAR